MDSWKMLVVFASAASIEFGSEETERDAALKDIRSRAAALKGIIGDHLVRLGCSEVSVEMQPAQFFHVSPSRAPAESLSDKPTDNVSPTPAKKAPWK